VPFFNAMVQLYPPTCMKRPNAITPHAAHLSHSPANRKLHTIQSIRRRLSEYYASMFVRPFTGFSPQETRTVVRWSLFSALESTLNTQRTYTTCYPQILHTLPWWQNQRRSSFVQKKQDHMYHIFLSSFYTTFSHPCEGIVIK
jgi:hypothetical protein